MLVTHTEHRKQPSFLLVAAMLLTLALVYALWHALGSQASTSNNSAAAPVPAAATPIAAAPTIVPPSILPIRIQVLGVATDSGNGSASVAMIDVEGQGPRAYRIGNQLAPDVTLVDVRSFDIVIRDNGIRRAIDVNSGAQANVQGTGGRVTQTGRAAANASGYGASAPALSEASQVPQSGAGTTLSPGSDAFLKKLQAIRESRKTASNQSSGAPDETRK
jgi:hypothetical protein